VTDITSARLTPWVSWRPDHHPPATSRSRARERRV